MPPLPVIGNCFRIGLPWTTYAGVSPYNVFHILANTSDLVQIGDDLGEAMNAVGPLFAPLVDQYSISTVDITPLDGHTPTQQVPLGGDPITGGTGGDPIPQMAGIVSIRTNQRGPQGRGRLFVGPVAEGAQNGGVLADYSSASTAWDDLQDELASSPSNISLGVCSYTHAAFYGATTIYMERLAGTQRRRMSSLRRS
jgi:hypothetical protein